MPSVNTVNIISSQVPGAEVNRGKSESSDQTGLVRFSFSFLLLFAFCSFSRRSYDTLHDTGRPFGKEPNSWVFSLPIRVRRYAKLKPPGNDWRKRGAGNELQVRKTPDNRKST